MTLLTIILLFLTALTAYKYSTHRPLNFPPGPPRIPIFGSYLLLLLLNFKRVHLAIMTLCKHYKSTIIGFYSGGTLSVTANDPKSVREVLFSPDYDGRNDFFVARLRSHNYKLSGIFFNDGFQWQEQRRFALRNLRDFGFGRRFEDYEIEVRSEMEGLVKMIRSGSEYEHKRDFLRSGGVVLLPKALIGTIGNCFLQVLFNERIPRSEQGKLFEAGYGSMSFQKYTNEYGNLLSILPSLLSTLLPTISTFNVLRKTSMAMCTFMKDLIDTQISTYENGRIRHFLDTYIMEMKSIDGEKRGYTYDQLLMICTDFLFPSLSAIEFQIALLFRVLLHRRDILVRIQEEIEDVVGSGRMVDLNDRVSMPFTEATLRESLRYDTLVPSAVPHRTVKDTKLGGFDIPKDTFVIPNLHALNHSKEVWKDPENFRPERFLDKSGRLSLKLDKSLPFGGGRRLCAGETFARNTLFLCVTALLQNFNLLPVGEIPRLDDNVCGLADCPNDFWVKFESR